MTDPTKQAQAATAKTAREVIAEAVKAVEEWAHPRTPAEAALHDGYNTLFRKICGTHAELRALLDAPEGGAVQRLCEAATRLKTSARALLESKPFCEIDEVIGGPMYSLDQRIVEAESALAALRASPESVGGATPSSRAAEAINTAGRIVREAEAERDNAQRTASSLSVELAVAAKERDALKADLAAARGEVERMRAEIAGDSHTCANGTVRPYPSVVCSLCVSRGITPPPATEAPISERARLVYEGAVKFAAADPCAEEDSTPYVLGKHDRRAEFIAKYVEVAAEILAAAERAAQGEGGAS